MDNTKELIHAPFVQLLFGMPLGVHPDHIERRPHDAVDHELFTMLEGGPIWMTQETS